MLLDLETREGAFFRHGGNAHSDLQKHKIHVCHLYEPFLAWLYVQPLATVRALDLPPIVDFPPMTGTAAYRRPGKSER